MEGQKRKRKHELSVETLQQVTELLRSLLIHCTVGTKVKNKHLNASAMPIANARDDLLDFFQYMYLVLKIESVPEYEKPLENKYCTNNE